MICSFFGSRDFAYDNQVEIKLKTIISNSIEEGVKAFYTDGYGNFDLYMVKLINSMGMHNLNIANTIVLAYRTDSHIEKYDYVLSEYNAQTIYPFLDAPQLDMLLYIEISGLLIIVI